MASMASASVDAMSRRSAALSSLLGPCPVCSALWLWTTERPRICKQQHLHEMGCRKCVQVHSSCSGRPRIRQLRPACEGLSIRAPRHAATLPEPEQRACERPRHRRHRFAGSCRQGLRTFSKSKPIAGAITNAAPAKRVVDKAQAPDKVARG
ncbi:uncharacterized protein TrAtP1_003532 [Trichoderma atroviride]|uniref:uncharacterized protein n=1 Tax=Hypocrea atroviridis TaxID=63577 RepID=UPI0033348E5F|nr:hypothetical protein TrAtP1_003532 [Trichoderma atroviride]